MIKKIFILFIFSLASCGYQPLYSKKNSDSFIFKNINSNGNKKINRSIISTMSFKEDNEIYSYEKLSITSEKNILVTSKDTKGKPASFKMILKVNLEIEDKKDNLRQKLFSKEFTYENIDNKFDLSEYEIDLEKDLINQIVEEIIIYLNL